MLLNNIQINRHFILSWYFDTKITWQQRPKKSFSTDNNFHDRRSLNRRENTSNLFPRLSSLLPWPNNKPIDLLQSTKETCHEGLAQTRFKNMKREEKRACLYFDNCVFWCSYSSHHWTHIKHEGEATYLSHGAASLRILNPLSPLVPTFWRRPSFGATNNVKTRITDHFQRAIYNTSAWVMVRIQKYQSSEALQYAKKAMQDSDGAMQTLEAKHEVDITLGALYTPHSYICLLVGSNLHR